MIEVSDVLIKYLKQSYEFVIPGRLFIDNNKDLNIYNDICEVIIH